MAYKQVDNVQSTNLNRDKKSAKTQLYSIAFLHMSAFGSFQVQGEARKDCFEEAKHSLNGSDYRNIFVFFEHCASPLCSFDLLPQN